MRGCAATIPSMISVASVNVSLARWALRGESIGVAEQRLHDVKRHALIDQEARE